MVVKIKADKIFKITQACSCNEMEEVFETLPPELHIFASYKVGSGFFQWTLPGEGWERLSDANELDTMEVTKILLTKKESISNLLSSNKKINVDNIFTTPGPEYIFYKDSVRGKGVMLVGWDYKFPVKPLTGAIVVNGAKLIQRQNTIIYFTEAGEPRPSTVFEYKTYLGKNKEAVSDADGKFVLGDLVVGKPFEVLVKGLATPVTILPEKGIELYNVNLTGAYSLEISVNEDGVPAEGRSVTVEYQGNERDYVISSGKVVASLPYSENARCSVSVGDKKRDVPLVYPKTAVHFDVQTPLAEIRMSVFKNDQPLAGAVFSIASDGQTYVLSSDSLGNASIRLQYKPNTDICVEVEGTKSSQLMNEYGNKFVFDLHEDVFVAPRLKVVYDSGEVAMDYPLILKIDDEESSIQTNAYGICTLPKLKLGKTVKVSDGKDLNNSSIFTVRENEDEILFTVNRPLIRLIEFTAQDALGTPIANQLITLNQNGKEATLHLDSNGKATLSRDIFSFGYPVNCNLIANGLSKSSFSIDLAEDEDEYLLVFKTKRRSQWWKYIWEFLFSLLLILLVAFFWSLIVEMLF